MPRRKSNRTSVRRSNNGYNANRNNNSVASAFRRGNGHRYLELKRQRLRKKTEKQRRRAKVSNAKKHKQTLKALLKKNIPDNIKSVIRKTFKEL